MHTISIAISGAASDSVTIEVTDSDALPIYVKLKEVMGLGSSRKKSGRRKRVPPTAPESADTFANAAGEDAVAREEKIERR